MITRRRPIIVGLTTYNHENLAISVPGLARLGSGFTLVIHNDNPSQKLSRRTIRRMGYHGKLHIINTSHNIGYLESRLAILKYVSDKKIKSQWFVFVDDDDVLLNLNIPSVSSDNFAIIQNMAVIRTRLLDVLRIMRNPLDFTIDNENVCLVRPHVGLSGTLVRTPAMLRLANMLSDIVPELSVVSESLSFRPPIDMMMWSGLNIVSRSDNESATPIYMDSVNYIATDLDTAPTKYGVAIAPSRDVQSQIKRAIRRYESIIRSALTAAAPVGQEHS